MTSLLRRMLPHEASFFDMFIKQAENVHAGAKALVEMLTHYTGVPEQAQNIKAIEHTGDEITHALITKLNQTFVTPFDREDIHVLSTKVDDVLDLVDAAAARMVIYRVTFFTNLRAKWPLPSACSKSVTTSSIIASRLTGWRMKATAFAARSSLNYSTKSATRCRSSSGKRYSK